jgi:hypothetical protein
MHCRLCINVLRNRDSIVSVGAWRGRGCFTPPPFRKKIMQRRQCTVLQIPPCPIVHAAWLDNHVLALKHYKDIKTQPFPCLPAKYPYIVPYPARLASPPLRFLEALPLPNG